MKIVADTHMHTIACDHAYSTLNEMVLAAAEKGLKFVAITEHGIKIPDAPHIWHFHSMIKTIPNILHGVVVLKGCESNIINYDGKLDMPEELISKLDWVIASYHQPTINPSTIEDHTKGWIEVAKNPDVDVIGHSGDSKYEYDFERTIKVFKEYNKIVEINSYSSISREGSQKNCIEIAKMCKKHEVNIVVNSDAHFHTWVGEHTLALKMLEEIDFPERLIINSDYDRFLEIARQKSGRQLV